jgi:hypothetical protein
VNTQIARRHEVPTRGIDVLATPLSLFLVFGEHMIYPAAALIDANRQTLSLNTKCSERRYRC